MLLQFLESIGEFITSIIGMIINFFSMIGTLLGAIPRAITYVVSAVGYMPPFVSTVILVSIGVSVIITIINHWGN